MTILDNIVAHKRIEVRDQMKNESLDSLKQQLSAPEPNRSLRKRMDNNTDFHFICEIKKASPSKGLIQADFDPKKYARSYENGGAAAISVLTDRKFFKGSLEDLKLVKKTVELPVLRKDFIIDAYQIYESKLYGADIILLITKILSKRKLNEFIDLAEKLKLDVLIEFGERSEIKKFSSYRKNVILGINNRNLNTFEVDFQNSYHLKNELPKGIPIIAESGIKNKHDCDLLRRWGFNGALIGETLMKSSDPEELLKSFNSGVSSVNPA
jgi:indole-3-glycerol phosphate synthase